VTFQHRFGAKCFDATALPKSDKMQFLRLHQHGIFPINSHTDAVKLLSNNYLLVLLLSKN